MKRLKLKRITLLSIKEKKGKLIELDEGFNIILGENDTGKSSLLKSIFYAFGAKTKMHPAWIAANPIVIIDFDYDLKEYIILRDKTQIVVFDKERNIINRSESITKEFALFFSSFFNFKMDLTNNENLKQQATPAYCLLPFYIDQDLGWSKTWSSFESLSQFKNWKPDIISFHAGTRSSQYYLLKAERDVQLEKNKQLNEETEIIESIKKKLSENFDKIDVDIPLDEFKEEIVKLLQELNFLKKDVEKSREKLQELYNRKQIFEDQKRITEESLMEINSDYKFCINHLENDVECPICGALYDNSFAERFSIAKDEDTCLELLQELKKNIGEVEKDIEKTKDELFNKSDRTKEMEEILKTKKEQITLKDLINYKGKQNLTSILDKQLDEIKKVIGDILVKLKEIEKDLREIDSPEKKKQIVDKYRQNMGSFLSKLNVDNLSFDNYKNLDSKIDESGSDLPRALLGYFFSILDVIYKNSKDGTFFPIIIDAPKQQEQDIKNEKTILAFIRDNIPQDSQVILGVVDLAGVEFKARQIKLKDKSSLLNESDYPNCFEYYKQLISKVYA